MCGVGKQKFLPATIDKILVSSCLIGKKCSYDGGHRKNALVLEAISGMEIIDVCPEMLAGFPSPRLRSEIKNGDGTDVLNGKAEVVNENGENVTQFFVLGARRTLKIVKEKDIKYAILKARSPSCGSNYIYDGSFSGKLKRGDGVTAALLKSHGVRIYHEEDVEEILKKEEMHD